MGYRVSLLLVLLPALVGFDGARAREALDLAFHNLYSVDILAGVELAIEGRSESSGVRFAIGRKRRGDETRMLLYSTRGRRDAPRALLFQHPDGRDQIFVSDGPHGGVRPVTAGRRSWSLFGSDFVYEDLRTQTADQYRIEVLGTDEIDGEACRVLRLRPFDGPYRSIVIWLSGSRPVIVRADYFDAKGLWKRYTALVERISRHFEWWVPMEDQMFDLRTGSRTVRKIRNILVDMEVPDELFTTTRLSRGRLPRF
jgi:hypothetical protein